MQLQTARQMPPQWKLLDRMHRVQGHSLSATKAWQTLGLKRHLNGHTHSFRTESCRRETEMAKYIWEIKDNNQPYEIDWSIAAYKCGTRRCDICITEKTVLAAAGASSTLNKRAEIISTRRHHAKFCYDRVSGAPTWWASRLGLFCWRYHGSPLGQWHIIHHPASPSLVLHGHLTLTPQCTI